MSLPNEIIALRDIAMAGLVGRKAVVKSYKLDKDEPPPPDYFVIVEAKNDKQIDVLLLDYCSKEQGDYLAALWNWASEQ